MAKVDVARRAEIGRDRRAKTRAQLMQAARRLCAQRPMEAVTIDELVTEAGMAKGTFYVHFHDFADLRTAMADEITQEFDDLVQPLRRQFADPVERIAAGCAVFVGEAVRHPAWAALVAQSYWALPSIGQAARAHLTEDLEEAARQNRLGAAMTPELCFEIVIGIVLQIIRSAGELRLSAAQAPTAVAAILRAIGIEAGEARATVERVLDRSGSTRIEPAISPN